MTSLTTSWRVRPVITVNGYVGHIGPPPRVEHFVNQLDAASMLFSINHSWSPSLLRILCNVSWFRSQKGKPSCRCVAIEGWSRSYRADFEFESADVWAAKAANEEVASRYLEYLLAQDQMV